jgi:hypothetical protein
LRANPLEVDTLDVWTWCLSAAMLLHGAPDGGVATYRVISRVDTGRCSSCELTPETAGLAGGYACGVARTNAQLARVVRCVADKWQSGDSFWAEDATGDCRRMVGRATDGGLRGAGACAERADSCEANVYACSCERLLFTPSDPFPAVECAPDAWRVLRQPACSSERLYRESWTNPRPVRELRCFWRMDDEYDECTMGVTAGVAPNAAGPDLLCARGELGLHCLPNRWTPPRSFDLLGDVMPTDTWPCVRATLVSVDDAGEQWVGTGSDGGVVSCPLAHLLTESLFSPHHSGGGDFPLDFIQTP